MQYASARLACSLFQSARLQDGLWREFWDGLFIIPRRWRPQGTVALRYDTPVRAACAGFWHLHDLAPRQATTAFAAVRSLPYGEELHANAQALTAAMDCQSLADIAAWKPPEQVDGELLRPQVHALLTQLSQVAQDVALVQQSRPYGNGTVPSTVPRDAQWSPGTHGRLSNSRTPAARTNRQAMAQHSAGQCERGWHA